MRSDNVKKGAERAPNRSLFYAMGYTKEELEQTASETNRQFVEKLREKGVQILENNDKIEKNISGYRISGKLTVIEPAAVRAPVSESSISAAH